MDFLPESVLNLLDELSRLPGIGPKSAQRLAFWLLKRGDAHNQSLGEAILNVKKGVMHCERCFTLSSEPLCVICSDVHRDETQLCVVENTLDLIAIERTGVYRGHYHVLGGKLSPLEGVGPEDLHLAELFARLTDANGHVSEVILALNPDLEGDTTALFIQKKLEHVHGPSVSRLARGLPSGASVEYSDDATLVRAIAGRQKL